MLDINIIINQLFTIHSNIFTNQILFISIFRMI